MNYDAVHHTRFVDTLRHYFDDSGHEQMAVALSIHPSTLKYRLRRIREILDIDLTRPDLRFNIELALRLSEGSAVPAPTRRR